MMLVIVINKLKNIVSLENSSMEYEYYCPICKNPKLFPTEGRKVDGSWPMDKNIPRDSWVCSWRCYVLLLEKYEFQSEDEQYPKKYVGG